MVKWKKVSKSFEWKIESEIRRKLRTFETLELPLLQEHGFDLTTNGKHPTTNSKASNDKEIQHNLNQNVREMGSAGFEPATSSARGWHHTKLDNDPCFLTLIW